MAMIDVVVPQLSESVSEATLLNWKKQPGEAIEADEILIEVETDKVVLEVPAPASGVLKEIVKGVMDGDPLVPVDVLYPPAMIATAMQLTADGLFDQVPVNGEYILDATLVTKDNAEQFYFPDSPF